MKFLKYIFLIILLIIVAGAIYVATLDSNYDVNRSHVINAPAEVVYSQVNDFKNWPSWSPWLSQDPEANLNFGDKSSGEGAAYSWSGNVVGEGNMETVKVIPNDSIGQKITFIKPWESESDIYWNFKPTGEGTEVTWGMKGTSSFMEKAFMAFNGGMDKMIGPDYEKGLANLDSVVQVAMKKYSVTVNGITTHGGGYYLYNTTSCKIDEIPDKMAEMMPQVGMYVQKNNIPMAGAPFTLYHKYDTENNAVIFSCSVPVTDRVITDANSGIQTGMLQPFTALKTTLKGNYDNLEEAWNAAMKYIADNGLKEVENNPYLEVYQTDPMTVVNPADWITEIYIPVEEPTEE